MIQKIELNGIGSVVAAVVLMIFATSAHAATRTWDGGGTTNNWSEAANWSGDVVPEVNDSVVFDGTSGKSCVIDITFVAGVNSLSSTTIETTYSGIVSIAPGLNLIFFGNLTIRGGTFTLADGSFTMATPIAISGGTFNSGSGPANLQLILQSGGTFNGSGGQVSADAGVSITGGVFNAPSGTLSVGGNISLSGGTFNHNSGTVVFVTGSNISANVPVFNNLTINKPGLGTVSVAGTSRVIGTLTLTDGGLGAGILRAESAISIVPTFDGRASGSGGQLLIQDGTGPRSVTFPAGVLLPDVRVNDGNVTIGTSGAGSIRTDDFIIDAGSVDFAANDLAVNGFSNFTMNGGSVSFTSGDFSIDVASSFTVNGGTFTMGSGTADMSQIGAIQINGGTFNAPSGTTTFNTNATQGFVQTGGIFNGNGTVDFNGNFQLSGGSFNASPGSTHFGAGFVHVTAGTFNHNSGTAVFDSPDDRIAAVTTGGNREIFNNVTFDTPTNNAAFTFTNPTIFQVNGHLRILNGRVNSANPSFATNGIEALGDVTIGPNADGGTTRMTFIGSGIQIFSNNGGLNSDSTWTIAKTAGNVSLATDLTLQTGQTLDITSGELNQGASGSLTVGTVNIAAAGVLKNYGNGDLTIGGAISNSGLIDLDGGGAPCAGTDVIAIRSTTEGIRRSWSGSGAFVFQDVDVKDQGGAIALTAFSSTDSGNNNANWAFSAGDLALVWDGGGSTNDWSEGANWNRNTPPAVCNIAVFDATSVKNATLDATQSILGLRINSGYSGSVTQAAGAILNVGSQGIIQSSGIFATGTGSQMTVDGNYALNGGNFNGNGVGSSADVNGEILVSGGSFIAPAGILSLAGDLTRTSGTITTSTGMIIFDGGSESEITLPTGHQFSGLRVEKTGGASVVAANSFSINGPLELIDGLLESASLDVRNDALFGAGFEGGASFINLNGGTAFDNSYEAQAGAQMPDSVIFNNPSATLSGTGTGTVTWGGAVLSGGQISQGTPAFVFNGFFQQSNSTTFTASDGLTFMNGFAKTGGTFVAPSGSMSCAGLLSISGGGFDTNGGTIRFDGSTDSALILPATPEILFNNVEFASTDGFGWTINRPMNVSGSLSLINGIVNFGNTGDHFDLDGNLSIGSDFDGGNAAMQFSGTSQSVSNLGGSIPSGTWKVMSGAVTLATNLSLQPTQLLEVTGGTFSAANGIDLTLGLLNVGGGGRFGGGPNLSLNIAGSVSNNGRVDLSGGGSCPGADTVTVRSTVPGAQRNWSGSGRYQLVNVDVRDMASATEIKVFNGTDSGNNTNWTIESGCLIRVVNTNSSGSGSLREAINQSNLSPGRDTIGFDIAGTGPFLIDLSTLPLPEILDATVVDATTQLGYVGSPLVELDGVNRSNSGLRIRSDNCVVKGLAINRFATAISIGFFSASIGRNTLIQSNFVGLSTNGAVGKGNTYGIQMFSGSNTIGGDSASERNVISGNHVEGISNALSTEGSVIHGNYFGTDVSGTVAIPNGTGIFVQSDSLIGGPKPGEGNLFAFNGVGIRVSGSRNPIRKNSIHSNSVRGIDLDPNGRDGNDPGDPDFGGNLRQNYPVVSLAVSDGVATTVHGSLNSKPSATYAIDFFSNPACASNGAGQGRTYLGTTTVSTDASNLSSFNVSLPSGTPLGHFITATATDADGNTSEFSQCRIVSSSVSSISGRIVNPSAQPLSYVTVALAGDSSQTKLTNSNGEFSFTNVATGGNYTVTPTVANHDFSPINRVYTALPGNQINQNFTGVKNRSTILGTITGTVNIGGIPTVVPLTGVTVNLSGTVARTATGNSQYFFNDLNPGTYTVTPFKDGWTFSPASVDITLTTSNQQVNLTALPASPLTGRLFYNSALLTVGAMNAAGFAEVTQLTPRETYWDHDVSPDGRKIAYVRVDGSIFSLYYADSDGNNETLLASVGGFASPYLSKPEWSPDGTRIVHVHNSGGGSANLLRIREVSGGTFSNVPSAGLSQISYPGWLSANRLVFSASDGNDIEIYAINTDGTNLLKLTNNSVDDRFPTASYDGSRIAYHSGLPAPNTLVVMNADGSNKTNLRSDAFPSNAAWSPDGSMIAMIRSVADPNYRTIAVNSSTGAQIAQISQFARSTPDWAPDVTIATPTGTDVQVNAGGVGVTFSGVSVGGNTVVTRIPSSSAGSAPNGFVLGGLAYEISTTAAYTSPVTVCFNVPSAIAPTLTAFNQLALLHNEGGVLVDRTTSRNFATRTICGSVTTLSPFVLGEQIDSGLATISGIVRDQNGDPMGDVLVQLTGQENRVAQTDAFGIFTFVNLANGGNYSVQPKFGGYLFSPYSQDFINLNGENSVVFDGASGTYSVGGRLSDPNGPLGGRTVEISGAFEGTAVTDSNGEFHFSGLPADGSVVVRPSGDGFAYSPLEYGISALTGDLTALDFFRLAPTAATAAISGRVVTADGNGIRNARVMVSGGPFSHPIELLTGSFGRFQFDGLPIGETYVVTVVSNRYRFAQPSRIITLSDDSTDSDFEADPR